jgi:hypothetical protein
MAVIFKIFLFLFLQQGTQVIDLHGLSNTMNMESVLLNRDMNLSIEGDQNEIDQMLSICTLYDNNCEVSHETETKTLVVFKNLKFTSKNRIMERSRPIHNSLQIQWTEKL